MFSLNITKEDVLCRHDKFQRWIKDIVPDNEAFSPLVGSERCLLVVLVFLSLNDDQAIMDARFMERLRFLLSKNISQFIMEAQTVFENPEYRKFKIYLDILSSYSSDSFSRISSDLASKILFQ